MNAFNWKWWSRIALGLLGAFLLVQLVPYGRDHSNPPATGEPTWDAPETRALAKQACFDCHSNETEWPAYASIAPVSWLVQRDVNEGSSRAELLRVAASSGGGEGRLAKTLGVALQQEARERHRQ
jgi:hypothetical protein